MKLLLHVENSPTIPQRSPARLKEGEPFLASNSSIYSSSSLKSPKSIQLTSTPYLSTRTPSYEKRRGPFTDLFSGDFGTSKKGKERENVPGSMASHSMTSNHSIDIQEANATPLPTTFNPRLEDVISYHLKNGLPGPEILSKFLSQNDLRVVRYSIKTHCHTVVQGEFEWLLDLKEAGYSDDAVLDSLLESTESGPWTTPILTSPGSLESMIRIPRIMFFQTSINLVAFTKALIVENPFLSLMALAKAPSVSLP